MEMKQTNLHLQVLREKYDKLNSRLQRSIKEGRFLRFSFDKKRRLFQSLSRYEKQLRHWGVAVATGVAMLMPGSDILAQNPTPVGSEFRVNDTTTGDQFAPAIAMDSDGDFVVTWNGSHPTSGLRSAYGKGFNNSGASSWGGEVILSPVANYDVIGGSKIAMAANGNFVVTWMRGTPGSSQYDIFARVFHSSGNPVSNEFTVNTYTTGFQGEPSIAMDSDGDFVIAWESYGQIPNSSSAQSEIYAQRFNAFGIPQGNEFRVNEVVNYAQRAPKVAMDNDGDFVITWESLEGSNLKDIKAKRYTNAGNIAAYEYRVNTYTTSDQFQPAIAMDSDGDFIITWTSSGQDGSMEGIYAQRYDHTINNSPVGAEFKVNSYTWWREIESSVAMDSDGDFVVTWSSFADGSSYGISAQLYNNSGVPQGGEFLVNSYTTGQQKYSSVAMESNGDFAVTWSSDGQDGSSRGVYAQRFGPPCTPTNWYADADGDGYGAGTAILACTQPANTSINNDDCDDNATTVNPGATETCNTIDDDCDLSIDEGVTNTYYADADGDGYGAGSAILSCTQPANTSANDDDCDDNATAVNPGATETCNTIDDDCDLSIDEGVTNTYYADADGDGHGAGAAILACTQPANTSTNDADCDDSNSAINPVAQEICNGGMDDDCDGDADDADASVTGQNTFYADADGDGYGVGGAILSCTQPANTSTNDADCDDSNSAISPATLEICNGGVDDDCDGDADDADASVTGQDTYYADADGDGYGAGAAILACIQPANTSTNNDDCDDNATAINPGATETCNTIDDDCDLSIDEDVTDTYYADADGDGYGAGAAILACTQPANTSINNDDCNDSDVTINPGAQEICNGGVDDDCDGDADNADPDVTGQNTYYADNDGDGYGAGAANLSCTQLANTSVDNTDCNDGSSSVKPGATEVCNNIDDDCDTSIDEGLPLYTYYQDADGDGKGNAAVTVSACAQPAGYVSNSNDCDDSSATACPKPTALTTSDIQDVAATVSWSGSVCAVKYRLEYRTKNPTSPWTIVYVTGATNYTLTGLIPNGKAYQWRVAAICTPNGTSAESGYLSMANFNTKFKVYTDADSDTFGDTGAAPAFVSSLPAPGFSVNNTDCDDTSASIYPAATELCNSVDDDCDGITDEGINWYEDADGDGLGNAAVSQNACVQPMGYVSNNKDCNDDSNTPVCSVPADVNATNVGISFATINWTGASCAYSYTVMYRTLYPTGPFSTQFNTSGTSLVLNGLIGNTTYQARVRAKCSPPNTVATSAWVYITFTTNGLGLVEQVNEEVSFLEPMSFDIYPNPGDGRFNISLSSEVTENVFISVMDGYGKLVHTTTWSLFEGQTIEQLDLSHLTGGVYQVQVQQGDRLLTKKIVIVR